MARGYIIPATLVRRGLARVVERSMNKMFPGTGMHAVPRDLSQYMEGWVTRGLTEQFVVENGEIISGSGKVGE